MQEIRNPDNRLICCFDEKAKVFERLEKGWITRIEMIPGSKIKVTHYKKAIHF